MHRIAAVCLVVTALLGLVAKLVFRPFVVSNGINDLGLSGVLPNFFWASFLTFVFALRVSPGRALGTSLAANVIYELDQLRSISRTFDPWDIAATMVGAGISYLILREIVTTQQAKAVEVVAAANDATSSGEVAKEGVNPGPPA